MSHESLNSIIANLYGEVVQTRVKRFAALRIKRNKLECGFRYVIRCRDYGVIPKFARIKVVKCIRDYETFFKTTNEKFLVRVIREYRRNISVVNNELFTLHLELSQCLRLDLWGKLDAMTFSRAENIEANTIGKHASKFKRLINMQSNARGGSVSQTNDPSSRSVVNLSQQPLSVDMCSVLSKGLNYALTPSSLPVESIVTSIEDTIVRNRVPHKEAECLRQDVSSLLRRSKLPKPNTSERERQALSALRKNDDILVLPADKGNASVVVDRVAYEDKVTLLVGDANTYEKVSYNPTARVTTRLNRIVSEIPVKDQAKKLRQLNPTCPKIYGLPKIHKTDWPLRPIVSQIDSPTYKASRFLVDILQPLTGNTTSFVRDSTHFVHLLENVTLHEDELMVSFDVASLFTNVPVSETIDIIKQMVIQNDLPTEYMGLIEFCLTSGYFVWRGEYYRQIEGVAMGSPIAPVVANIFMEDFERKALEGCPHRPRFWWRYVDDVFAVVSHKDVDRVLDHLNARHAKIKFTIEKECNGALPFLDVLVQRDQRGRLSSKVYRKPTHTDRYLQADSHHHPAHLSSVPRALINRALRLCDPQYVQEELQHVRQVLERNGYSWTQSQRVASRGTVQRAHTVERAPAYLPYIRGVTDKIGRLLRRRLSIRTIFRPHTKIRQVLRSPKDRDPLGSPGVYEIPCGCGKAYVGETGRNVSTRLLEHIRNVKKMDVRNSAVAEHACDTGASHFIRFDMARLLVREKGYVPRKIREAIEIGRRPNFNRDGGWMLPPAWKTIIPKLKWTACSDNPVDTVSSVCVSSLGGDDLLPQSHITAPALDAPPPPALSARATRAARREERARAVLRATPPREHSS
jgi:hypothetical protein